MQELENHDFSLDFEHIKHHKRRLHYSTFVRVFVQVGDSTDYLDDLEVLIKGHVLELAFEVIILDKLQTRNGLGEGHHLVQLITKVLNTL
jgi:hypothetical protein